MQTKHGIRALVLTAALLAPMAAMADHDEYPVDPEVYVGGAHVHAPGCGHAVPAGQPANPGRYELRTVQRWVPGHYEEVWVPERCQPRGRHFHMKCRGGYYDRRWEPGRYETVQDWVWVPAYRPREWRPVDYHPATPREPGRWGAAVGTRDGATTVHFEVSGRL